MKKRQSTAELRAACARLRVALVGLVGTDKPGELDRLEMRIRLLPASSIGDEERAMLKAIAALRQTIEETEDDSENAQYYWRR